MVIPRYASLPRGLKPAFLVECVGVSNNKNAGELIVYHALTYIFRCLIDRQSQSLSLTLTESRKKETMTFDVRVKPVSIKNNIAALTYLQRNAVLASSPILQVL